MAKKKNDYYYKYSYSDNSSHSGRLDPTTECRTMIGASMNFAGAESMKVLRTNLLFAFPEEQASRVIGITSSVPAEGKSMTSINLAYTMAQMGKKVLLIEGDMRKPRTASRMRLKAAPGLSDLLLDFSRINEIIQKYPVVVDSVSNVQSTLRVITAGSIPPNPSELLGSGRMEKLLEILKNYYDYIFIDVPPVSAVTDALIVGRLADGMILVVRGEYTSRGVLAESVRQLRLSKANVLGLVYIDSGNGVDKYSRKYYRKHYHYYKYYSDSKPEGKKSKK